MLTRVIVEHSCSDLPGIRVFVCYYTAGNLIPAPPTPTQGSHPIVNALVIIISAVLSVVIIVQKIAAAILRLLKRQQHAFKPSQQAAAVEGDCESPQAGGALNSSSEALTSRAPHATAADIPLLLPPDINELVLTDNVSLQPLDSVTGSESETAKPSFRENAVAVTGAIVDIAVQHAPIVNVAWSGVGAVAGNKYYLQQ
jgi:hypothetical protein